MYPPLPPPPPTHHCHRHRLHHLLLTSSPPPPPYTAATKNALYVNEVKAAKHLKKSDLHTYTFASAALRKKMRSPLKSTAQKALKAAREAKSTHGHAAKYKAYATIRGVPFEALISWPFKPNGIDIKFLTITVPKLNDGLHLPDTLPWGSEQWTRLHDLPKEAEMRDVFARCALFHTDLGSSRGCRS